MSIQRLLELNRERGQTNDHANTYLAVHPSVWQGLIADSIRESGTREDLSGHLARLISIPVGVDYTLPVGAWELRDQIDKRVIERGSAAPSDAAERRYRLRVEEPGDDEAWYTSWFEKESHALAALREYRVERLASGTRWQVIGQTVITNEEVLSHGTIGDPSSTWQLPGVLPAVEPPL